MVTPHLLLMVDWELHLLSHLLPVVQPPAGAQLSLSLGCLEGLLHVQPWSGITDHHILLPLGSPFLPAIRDAIRIDA